MNSYVAYIPVSCSQRFHFMYCNLLTLQSQNKHSQLILYKNLLVLSLVRACICTWSYVGYISAALDVMLLALSAELTTWAIMADWVERILCYVIGYVCCYTVHGMRPFRFVKCLSANSCYIHLLSGTWNRWAECLFEQVQNWAWPSAGSPCWEVEYAAAHQTFDGKSVIIYVDCIYTLLFFCLFLDAGIAGNPGQSLSMQITNT